jgi:hypothetical protein
MALRGSSVRILRGSYLAFAYYCREDLAFAYCVDLSVLILRRSSVVVKKKNLASVR